MFFNKDSTSSPCVIDGRFAGSVSVNNPSALIIGAGSDIGYNMATRLQATGKGNEVVLVEDYVGIELDSSDEKWFFIDKLRKEELNVNFKSFKSKKKIKDMLRQHMPQLNTVMYILSGSYQNVHLHDIYGIPNYSTLLTSFTHLLDTLVSENDFKQTRIVLIVDVSRNEALQKEIVKLFGLILLSYKNSHSIDATLVEVGSCVDNNCGTFENLATFVMYGSDLPETNSCSKYKFNRNPPSITKDKSLQSQDVLFTTYFTHNKQFVRPYKENSFQFLKGFYMTAKKHNLKIVMYHDEVSEKFQSSLLSYYNNITFIQYTGKYHHRTINDARFYIMYEYLLDHPEVDQIILQDLRDGIFYLDPFKVMTLIGDFFYSGMDISFRKERWKPYQRCEGNFGTEYRDIPRLYPMLNAGSIGGTRSKVLGFLTLAVYFFETLFPASKNCNMDLVDFVTHQYLYDTMFTGYPFQAFMQIGLASTPGTALRHKRTKYDA